MGYSYVFKKNSDVKLHLGIEKLKASKESLCNKCMLADKCIKGFSQFFGSKALSKTMYQCEVKYVAIIIDIKK